MLKSSSICHQGLVRERNEDSLLSNKELGLWVVADGVGGNSHGDVASQLVVQTVERRVRQGSSLAEAINEANEAIISAQEGQESLRGMATTVVACHFHGHQFELSWVGDSRAYLIDDDGIHQISTDHNLANELYSQGSIAESELREHSGQHELTQALGQLNLTEIPKSLGELHEGDILLLCTDGLSGPITDEQILQTVRMATDLDAACQQLLNQVLDAGAPDNVGLVLIEYVREPEAIKASDFHHKAGGKAHKIEAPKFEGSFRYPFDKKAYLRHVKSRPGLLALFIVATLFLMFFI